MPYFFLYHFSLTLLVILFRDKKVDNVRQKYTCSKITNYKLLYASCKI